MIYKTAIVWFKTEAERLWEFYECRNGEVALISFTVIRNYFHMKSILFSVLFLFILKLFFFFSNQKSFKAMIILLIMLYPCLFLIMKIGFQQIKGV